VKEVQVPQPAPVVPKELTDRLMALDDRLTALEERMSKFEASLERVVKAIDGQDSALMDEVSRLREELNMVRREYEKIQQLQQAMAFTLTWLGVSFTSIGSWANFRSGIRTKSSSDFV